MTTTDGFPEVSASGSQVFSDRDVFTLAGNSSCKTVKKAMLVMHGHLFRDGIQRVLECADRIIVGSHETLSHLDSLPGTSPPPDLFVVGIGGPEHTADTFDRIRALRARMPASRWIFLSHRSDVRFLREAVSTGVEGLLLEDTPGEVLRLLMELVLRGHSFVPAELARILSEGSAPADRERSTHPSHPPRMNGMAHASSGLHTGTDPSSWAVPVSSPSHAQETKPGVSGPGASGHNGSHAEPFFGRPANLSDREKEILGCLVSGHSNKLIARELHIAEATVKVHVKGLLRKMQVSNRTQAAICALKLSRANDETGVNDETGAPASRPHAASWEGETRDVTARPETPKLLNGHAAGD